MQVPHTLNFEGEKKHIIVLKNELGKIDKLRAIISLRREELTKPFVYGHTNV